jgi:hypothetical protein
LREKRISRLYADAGKRHPMAKGLLVRARGRQTVIRVRIPLKKATVSDL